MTKEQAQNNIDLIDVVSRNGVPINSAAPLLTIAQSLQAHIDAIKEHEVDGVKKEEVENENNSN